MKTLTIDGNHAAAYVAYAFSELSIIYPITPSSPMAELADEWQAQGKTNLFGELPQVVEMQSESGASGALHGALTCGALATTYTCSQGLLLMLPNMYKIAGELLPTVFHVSARALATHALSIFGDHQDVMAARQTGFAMLCASSVQETHDFALISHLVALKSSVPFLHFFDGFRTSHEVQKIQALEYEEMRDLVDMQALAHFRSRALSPDNPIQRGTAQNADVYFQNRERANERYLSLAGTVQECMDTVAKTTKRHYHVFDYYGADDAERVLVLMGSGAQTAQETVDTLNRRGEKTGVLIVRLYRPFDTKRFCNALPKTCKKIAVLDRTKEMGGVGEPLYLDVCTALREHGLDGINVIGGRYGLGQKEFTPAMVAAVFENLQSSAKNHFTVGIHDDITHTSLPLSPFHLDGENTTACLFYGLGSDGTVGANKNSIKIIGQETDLFVQGYFQYDSKKSGGVTVSHLRFGNRPIRSAYFVENADFIACHTPSYLYRYEMMERLRTGGTFLLNCPWADLDTLDTHLPATFKRKVAQKQAKLYVIDGTEIAHKHGLNGKHSIVMQAAFFYLNPTLMPYEKALDCLKSELKNKFSKKGETVVTQNILAAESAKDRLCEIRYPQEWATAKDEPVAPAPTTDEYYHNFIAPILRMEGDSLPVSAFREDGSVPTDTAKHEKHGVADDVPKWIAENCIQCNQCSLVCPHACIRPFVFDETAQSPTDFHGVPAVGLRGKKFRIQVAINDCMGCGVCARTCPAKQKALVMSPVEPLRERESTNWDFALTLPPLSPELYKANTVKGSQFRKPLFEFSYACAGCGETPYVKLLTQLFGDRLLIANATGCSSIYGGSTPTCPYAIDENGHGPAWANSLFEDNAEFGFGMHLAYDRAPDGRQKSVWCIGGDGWAYDIGYGGLDHVLASGRNVNILVLDSEVYSNTGGQMSKATPLGATARFAANGKRLQKKPLAQMAMAYKNVYVAQVALGGNMQQLVKALCEAESYDGPSIVIAYTPCIAHGVSMSKSVEEEKRAVECGYWHLFRFDPRKKAEGKNPFMLDSRAPTADLREFLLGENRFRILHASDPATANALFAQAEEENKALFELYQNMAK